MGLADGCPRAGFPSLGRDMPEPRPEGTSCASSNTCQVGEPQSYASFSAGLESTCMRRLRAPLYPPGSEDSHGWTTSKRLHPRDCCDNRTLAVA
jgi:hypothetical protein